MKKIVWFLYFLGMTALALALNARADSSVISGGGGGVTSEQLAAATNALAAGSIQTNTATGSALFNRATVNEVYAQGAAGLKLLDSSGYGIFVQAGGNVGIGTNDPIALFHVAGPEVNDVAMFERSVCDSDSTFSACRINATMTNDMSDGFGPLLAFSIEDYDSGSHDVGYIGAVRAGADNTGDLVFRPVSAGSPSEAMRITSSGSVGIGTNAPAALLSVVGSGDGELLIVQNSSGNDIFRVYNDDDDGCTFRLLDNEGNIVSQISSEDGGDNYFGMSSGNVGIGTNDPQYKLDVVGDINATGELRIGGAVYADTDSGNAKFHITRQGDSNQTIAIWVDDNIAYFASEQDEDSGVAGSFNFIVDDDGTSVPYVRFSNKSGSEIMRMLSSGNVGIGTNAPQYLLDMEGSDGGYYDVSDHDWHTGSSHRRIKTDIKDTDDLDALSILKDLHVHKGRYRRWRDRFEAQTNRIAKIEQKQIDSNTVAIVTNMVDKVEMVKVGQDEIEPGPEVLMYVVDEIPTNMPKCVISTNGNLGMRQSFLILTKAIQQQQKQIELQQVQINNLRQRIKALEDAR